MSLTINPLTRGIDLFLNSISAGKDETFEVSWEVSLFSNDGKCLETLSALDWKNKLSPQTFKSNVLLKNLQNENIKAHLINYGEVHLLIRVSVNMF